MSLNLTPTSNKYDRPLPPSRSKRSAQTNTLDSTPSRSPAPFDGEQGMDMASREELEDEIRRTCLENEKVSPIASQAKTSFMKESRNWKSGRQVVRQRRRR